MVAFATTLVLAFASSPAHAAYGLAAEWLLDDGAGSLVRDTSGAGHDGRLADDASTPTRIFGVAGAGLHFDGDDEVVMPDSRRLEPARLTVEAWVRNGRTPGQYRYVMSKGATACDTSSYGLYTGSSGGLAFYVSGQSGYVASAQALQSAVWDGAWHHAAGTYDGETVRLFIDGDEVGSGRAAPAAIVYGLPSTSLRLGTYRGACTLPFTGDIDTVRIWNLALTRDEIAAAPAAPTSRPQPDPDTPRPGAEAPRGSGTASPSGCLTVAPSTRRVSTGRRTRLTATVRRGGRRAARVRVVLSAKGLPTSVRRTDRLGRARFVVWPRRTFTIRLRAYGTRPRCRPAVANVSTR